MGDRNRRMGGRPTRHIGRRRAAVFGVALLVILAGVAVGIFGFRHTAREKKLTWAPPVLEAPTRIMLKSGLDPENLRLSRNRDYVLQIPRGGIHGTVEINGGHNVTLIGGSVTVPSSADQTDNGADNTDTAIYVRHSTGTVHIEGVLIDADRDVEYDGIDINAPQATVQIENVRMEDLYGSLTTEHADAIQTWGGVKTLEIDDLTAGGDYQGLTINPNLGSVGSADIKNVDLIDEPRPEALAGRTTGGGIMLWLTTGTHCNAPPVTLDHVYLENTTERLRDPETVWPSHESNSSCAGIAKSDEMTWPQLPVSGIVRFGAPPGGSFVPSGVAGNGYTSPGYLRRPSGR